MLIGLGALATLAGCGENRLATTVLEAYRLAFVGQPDATISRQTIDKIPYASIAAKIGNGPRSLLVLWRIDRSDLHWLSADNVTIVTRAGRVVETAGLPEDMRGTIQYGIDPLEPGLHNVSQASYMREVDFMREGHVVSLIASRFERLRPEVIRIEEIDFETILFREESRDRTLNWSFENLYWVDPADGFVWKSRQHIARSFPPIEIEVLKPAA